MTNASNSRTTAHSRASARSTVIAAVVAAVAISLANFAIASISLGLGTPAALQLTPGPYLSFSVVTGVLGAIGWVIVRRRAADPRRTLTILAVTAFVVSLVPLAVLAAATVAALGWAPIVTLAIMHAATVGVAVIVYSVVLPVTSAALTRRGVCAESGARRCAPCACS